MNPRLSRGRILRAVTGLFLAIVSVQASQPQQNQDSYTAGGHLRKPSKHSALPVQGEFQEKQPEPRTQQEHRQKREERYGSFLREPITDPGPMVDGQPETTNLSFIDYVSIGNSVDPRGIPASVSTAVVIGTILSGRTFMNKAHTFVYSDYQVKIEQVLKQDPAAKLAVGGQLVASRMGGAIHFPSGHVTNFLYAGHGFPEIGSQYLLFLWRAIPDLSEYEIITDSGYQLKNGRVFPLDDANIHYDDVSEPVFLDLVQKAVTSSKNGGARP